MSVLIIFIIFYLTRHLLSLKHYDGNIEDLDLNFTVTISDFGQSKVIFGAIFLKLHVKILNYEIELPKKN